MAVAGMPGLLPCLAIDADQASHLLRLERDRHHLAAVGPGERESLGRVSRGDPERRVRLLRRPRHRRDVAEAVELALRRYLLVLEQQRDLRESLGEAPAAFVEAHAELRELMRQEGAGKADLEPSVADAVEHA